MAFKPLFVAMVAWSPSLVYIAWRMVLRPLPSVAIAVFGCFMEFLPYKPYDSLTLMLLVPVVAKLAQWLRSSPGFSVKGAVLRGLWLGAVLGVIFLVYSGWHWWSFPGTAVLVAALFPWRRAGREGRLRGFVLLGGALAGFLAVGGVYLREMLGATGTKDTWCSYVTQTDPGYIGQLALSSHLYEVPGTWPPPGEIAGLGVFALAVTAGLGVAVAFGLRRAPVAATVACFVSSWFLRFYLAHNMENDSAVQLFPRTAMEIQYTLIVLAVLACVLCADRLRALAATLVRLADSRRINAAGLRPARFGALGVLLSLVLLGGMGASYLTDQYMPAPAGRGTQGYLALTAQQLREPDGTCPDHAGSSCVTPNKLRPFPTEAPKPLQCKNLYQRFDPPAAKP